jgi:hypothetical protein
MADAVHDYKMRFAALLARVSREKRLQSAIVIAKQVVGSETADKFPMYVIRVSEEWPHDPEVIEEIDRLDLIPKSKESILRDVYSMYSDPFKDDKVRLRALEIYGQMNGWIKGSVKESGVPNEFLDKLQQLHNAVTNPVET